MATDAMRWLTSSQRLAGACIGMRVGQGTEMFPGQLGDEGPMIAVADREGKAALHRCRARQQFTPDADQ